MLHSLYVALKFNDKWKDEGTFKIPLPRSDKFFFIFIFLENVFS